MTIDSEDYYKKYKKQLRDSRKTSNKKLILALIAVPVIIGLSIYFVLSNKKTDNNTSQKEPSEAAISNNEPNQTSFNNTEEAGEEQKVLTYEEFLEQYGDTIEYDYDEYKTLVGSSEDVDNTEAFQRLQEQIAANEAEKQRIAQESAATTLKAECDTIGRNYSTEYHDKEREKNSAISDASMQCASRGQSNCPESDRIQKQYTQTLNQIKANYESQLAAKGCPAE